MSKSQFPWASEYQDRTHMFGWFRKKSPDPIEPSAAAIVPRIKHLEFVESLREMEIPREQMPISEPIAGELLVTYAYDLPDMFAMVTPASLDELSIDASEVH
ncbi:MAG: hypothetical protein AAF483_26645, partial [Planctomycetota bacterium]